MAKKNSSSRRKSSSSRNKSSSIGWLNYFFQALGLLRHDPETREQLRRVAGWTLIFICVMGLISCISYFFHGDADQSAVESISRNQSEVKNWLGKFGAFLASYIVYKGFGIFGLIIPLYGIFFGLVLLEDNFYSQAKRILIFCLFVIIWGSVSLSFIIDLSLDGKANHGHLDYGGGVGFAINYSLYRYIGKLGVFFLLLFTLIVFFVITFGAEIRASHLLKKLQDIAQGKNTPSFGAISIKDKLNVKSAAKRNRPINHSGEEQLKKQAGTKEEDTQSNSSTIAESKIVASTSSKDQHREKGEQISLEVMPEVLKPIPSTPNKEESKDEFVIEVPEEEETVPLAPSETELKMKEFIQLGEDNIGRVVGEEGRIEKIVPIQDQETNKSEEVIDWEAFDPTLELSDYEPPKLELLDDHGYGRNREVNRDELVANKNKIVETLSHYGIEITSIKASPGPTVTLYEIVPAPGVRISKIRNLEDDIALSLAALGIRIIAPIPGKGTIGIEVPLSSPEVVSLRGVLSTVKFQTTKKELPIAIGRTISNEVFISDLNKMPHLLIAGATGQGKSVGLNTIIASLLYKKHPAEIKFVLIDPKKVEMSLYHSLSRHFIAMLPDQEEPVITDVKDAITSLKSLCIEMDDRYDLLKKAKVRNLKEYNTKFTARKLSPRKGHRFLPYIVLIIDELADMMMIGGKEVEMPIARLAQLARAVGIHLVVATQRPSVNIITGIIKANFPARLSYRVISKIDSRTILDANGADQLIGRGDCLLSTGSDLIRIQNAFIDTPEVERVVEFIADQRGFTEPYFLPDIPSEGGEGNLDEPFERDDYFEEAARLLVRHQMGSASLIQRKLKLGYNRAGRIIDQLERANIVGPHSGSKAREVLIQDEVELERYLENLY